MIKVGIITVHNSPSFGASLQSYALYRYLLNQGVECSIIDLYRPANDGFKSSKKYISYKEKKRSFLKKIRSFVKRIIKGSSSKRSWKHVSKMKFDEFNSVIRKSKPYYCIDDLYLNPPQYDIYISGSDQLWNPDQPYCVEPYFLTFVNNGGRKISYASSIGLSGLKDAIANDYKKWLADFDAIAVREKTAQQIVHSLLHRDVPLVLDPTFLLDKEVWEAELIPPSKTNYILLFTLGSNESLANIAYRYAQEKGFQIIGIGNWENSWPYIKKCDDIGPREFLGFIKNAEAVFTDSFHGTVFSIIFGVKRIIPYVSKTSKRGSRIVDLLRLFNLDHLLVSEEMSIEIDEIDWTKVVVLLNRYKEKSRGYLEWAMNQA